MSEEEKKDLSQMSLIKDLREDIWALPLVGGILMLISIFTPAYSATLYTTAEEFYWMWGLSYTSLAGHGSQTEFLPAEEPAQYLMPVFLVGFIPFLLILICSIVLLISGNAVRTGRCNIKHHENLWIVMGITMFVAPIIFIVGIDITTKNYLEYRFGLIPPGYDFWGLYNPGFAVIAPFIGGVLSIAGSVASKKIFKK